MLVKLKIIVQYLTFCFTHYYVYRCCYIDAAAILTI